MPGLELGLIFRDSCEIMVGLMLRLTVHSHTQPTGFWRNHVRKSIVGDGINVVPCTAPAVGRPLGRLSAGSD